MADVKFIEIQNMLKVLRRDELVNILCIVVEGGYNSILRESRDGIRFDISVIDTATLNKIYNFVNNIKASSKRGGK